MVGCASPAELPKPDQRQMCPVLGPRLRTCAAVVAETTGRTAEQIFGGIDAMKLRSSMTLFLRAAPEEDVFASVLRRYFDAEPDPATDSRL